MDRFVEILQSLDRNRVRTLLTALSVAWGIFMLVLLLAAGTGLENAVAWEFRDDATNSLWVRRGQTSLPYKGHRPGRRIRFTNADHERIASLEGVEYITSRYYLWGGFTIRYKGRHGSFDVRACHPDHQYLEKTEITSGRFLDELDLVDRRKVTVIGQEVADHLFRGADPLGEWIDIKGISYRVVGVFQDVGGLNELRKVYIPISTAQAAYGGGDTVHAVMFTVGDLSVEQSHELEEEVRQQLASVHNFDPKDPRAVRIRNTLEDMQKVTQTFSVIRTFLWIVGLGTVAAGVVGVGNILLVSVAERTGEIGVRKALGATPITVVLEILQEAVLLTSVSGYLGLVLGVVVVELLNAFMPENDYLRSPSVDLSIAFTAIFVLVVAGVLAGLVPAWRAARIDPARAIREGT
ncbi:MAG: ABC transporter permease [Myxococcota bacterium]